MNLEKLQYPIGKHIYQASATVAEIKNAIDVLENFPKWVEAIAQNVDEKILQKTYRPNGWTFNQVVHHCADSHMNCLMRLKLTLTEDCPTIKPYLEDKCAELPDYHLPIELSITQLHVIHLKLVTLFKSLTEKEFERNYIHPEHNNKTFNLIELLMLYKWHCQHHFEHLRLIINS